MLYIFYLTLTNCNTGIPICQHFFYVFQRILLIYPLTAYGEYDKSHSIHNLTRSLHIIDNLMILNYNK